MDVFVIHKIQRYGDGGWNNFDAEIFNVVKDIDDARFGIVEELEKYRKSKLEELEEYFSYYPENRGYYEKVYSIQHRKTSRWGFETYECSGISRDGGSLVFIVEKWGI